MRAKKGLLSIGELSKLTGASLRSLRYYESLGILIPAYVDPDSSYRYYSLEQAHLVELILLCIELDIPLKEFANFMDADKNIDFPALLAKGRLLAQVKMKTLERGLALIEQIDHQIQTSSAYPKGEIYTKVQEEQWFYVYPLQKSATQKEVINMVSTLWEVSYTPYLKNEAQTLAEYGLLHRHTEHGVKRFAFLEVTKQPPSNTIWHIPAGTYHCMQQDGTQIEDACKLFSSVLAGKHSFLAIEVEVFTPRHNMSMPTSELRVIELT